MGIGDAWADRQRLIRAAGSACLVGGVAVLVAACAGPPDLTSLAGSPSATPTPTPTSAPATVTSAPMSGPGWFRPAGEHPQRDVTLGDDVDLTDEPGYPEIAVTVARVTRDAGCAQGPPPRLGQYLALDLIVRRTRPGNDVVGLTTLEWVALGPDGTTTTTHGLSGFLCQKATEQFPLRFGERDEVRGRLVIDAPRDTVMMSATVPWDHRAARLLIPAGDAVADLAAMRATATATATATGHRRPAR